MSKWLLAVLALVGCYEADAVRYRAPPASEIAAAPPAPVAEVPPLPPSPSAVWTAGFWSWRPVVRRYEWIPGRYVAAPRPGVVYLPPTWRRGPGGWRQVPGRWIERPATDRYGERVWYDSAGRAHYF